MSEKDDTPRILHVGNIYCYDEPTHGGRGGDMFLSEGLCPALATSISTRVPYLLTTMDKSNDNKTCKVEQGLLNGAKGGVAPTLTACYGKCRSYTNAYGKHRYPFVIERYEWKQ